MEILNITSLKSLAYENIGIAKRNRQNLDISSLTLITVNNNRLDEAINNNEIQLFDIFLSHAFKDADIVAGIMLELMKLGYTVYVDWIFDPQVDRSAVNKSTADMLVKRMKQSRSLFYATTVNAPYSKWMPWELGFKHGHNGKCAILPVKESPTSSDFFIGQEYLGVYKKVVKVARLWVCQESYSELKYCELFDSWAGVSLKKVQTLRTLGILI